MIIRTVPEHWIYWLRVLKRFEGRTVKLSDIIKHVFGEYDPRVRKLFSRTFRSLQKNNLVDGEIFYELVGKRNVPFVRIRKVPEIHELKRGKNKVKILALYEEETLSKFLGH